MPKYRCNSCGGTYDDPLQDGMRYFHACPTETIEPEEQNSSGLVTKQEKRTPRVDMRDERPKPGMVFLEGKCMVSVPNPEERGKFFLQEDSPAIVSEGKGRTQLE